MHKQKFGLRVFGALGWNFIEKNLVFFISFLISIFLTRYLRPEGYGLYASLMSIAALLPMLISLGFAQILNVYVPKFNAEGNNQKINFLLRKIVFIRGILSLISSILLYLFALSFASKLVSRTELIYYFKYISIYILLENFVDIFGSLNIGLLEIKKNAFINIFSRSMCFIFLIFFLRKGYGLAGVFYSLIISALFSVLAYLKGAVRYFRGTASAFPMSDLYKFGIISWLTVFINFILGKNSDILLMNIFKIPNVQIGFYNLAISLTMITSLLILGTGPVSQTIFSESVAGGGREKLGFAWHFFIKLVTILMFPVFVFFFVYIKDILSILYTPQYLPVSSLFRIYSFLIIIYTLIGGSQCIPIFYVLHKRRLALYLMTSCGLINLLVNIILIPRLGPLGAVIGTGSSYLLMGIFGLIQVKRFIRVSLPRLFYLKIFFASFLAILPTMIMRNSSPYLLSINVFIFTIAFIASLYLLKPLEETERAKLLFYNNGLFKILAKF